MLTREPTEPPPAPHSVAWEAAPQGQRSRGRVLAGCDRHARGGHDSSGSGSACSSLALAICGSGVVGAIAFYGIAKLCLLSSNTDAIRTPDHQFQLQREALRLAAKRTAAPPIIQGQLAPPPTMVPLPPPVMDQEEQEPVS